MGSGEKDRRNEGDLTSDTNTVDIIRDDAGTLDDAVELGAGTVKDDRVEADAVEEAEVESKLIYLVEDGTADLDDGEFCGVGGI